MMVVKRRARQVITSAKVKQQNSERLMVIHHSSKTNGAQMTGSQPCSVTQGEVIHAGMKYTWFYR